MWLREYGLKTKNSRGRRPKQVWQAAKAAGELELELECKRHGRTTFLLEGRGYYRCKRCRSERVAKRRRDVKALLVAEAGGQCELCGYDRSLVALQFHHLQPGDKQFNIALRGVARSIDRVRQEAAKCALLCANCHAEVEAGLVSVPARVRSG